MQILPKIKNALRRFIRPPLHQPDVSLPYVFFGNEYGGWPLLKSTQRGALIYSFGIGEDISFDLAAIEKLNCRIHAFDPTPKSLRWIESQSRPKQFTFHPVGISNMDGETTFFPPANPEYVSYSAAPSPESSDRPPVMAKVLRLESIVSELKTSTPDVLKMDIEGFEYVVIDNILNSPIRPAQVLVEFHHGMYKIPNDRTIRSVKKMQSAGYRLFFVSSGGHEYGFSMS